MSAVNFSAPDAFAARVLFIDDDPALLRSMVRSLQQKDPLFECFTCERPEDVESELARIQPLVVVLDLSLDPQRGPEGGLEVLRFLQRDFPALRCIVLTGHANERMGLRALELGAASFLGKPADPDHLFHLINDALNFAQLRQRFDQLQKQVERTSPLPGFSTQSPQMRKALEEASYAASHSLPVLITGETGTGKGVLAQAIHANSGRAKGPFVRFQPAFGSHDLTASELFGHQRGAFTGALQQRRGLLEDAHRGSLFIDEIDELPLETQISLLNVIQERVFRRLGSNQEVRTDFRLISACNRPLSESLETGKLRLDFYHRISHVNIHLLPLRERTADIGDLAKQFLDTVSTRERMAVSSIEDKAMSALRAHAWPGNVRELQAVVESAAHRAHYSRRHSVLFSDLALNSLEHRGRKPRGTFREKIRAFEREIIREALAENQHNQTQAAKSLGLDRTTMRRILQRETQRKVLAER